MDSRIKHVGPVEQISTLEHSTLAFLHAKPIRCERLRVAGRLPNFERAVAIVGTRYSTKDADRFAEKIAYELTMNGCCVVSGGAYGIDAAAHRGALAALGETHPCENAPHTVAVLGSGLVDAYPPQHGKLFSDILSSGGALITETVHDHDPSWRARFIQRNRIIAALSRVVIVVQAPARSGALSTARFAHRLGRPVWVVPGPPWDPRFEGNLEFLKVNGVSMFKDAPTLLKALSWGWVHVSKTHSKITSRAAKTSVRSTLESGRESVQVIVSALRRQPMQVDELIEKTGLSPNTLQGVLLEAMLQDLVEEQTGGRYGLKK